jgi:hypothetical protein
MHIHVRPRVQARQTVDEDAGVGDVHDVQVAPGTQAHACQRLLPIRFTARDAPPLATTGISREWERWSGRFATRSLEQRT